MAETNKKFTPEQIRDFEDKFNLGVSNHEALIEILMQQDKRIQQLEERLVEVASYIPVMSSITTADLNIKTLADKWNK